MLKKIAFLLVAAFLFAMPALADTTITLGPSYLITSKTPVTMNIPDRMGLAIGLDFGVSKHFSISPYLYTNWNQIKSYQTGAKAGYNIFGVDLNLRYTINPQDKINFWATGGASYIRSVMGSTSDITNSLAPNIGLGFNYPLSKNFGFTLEGKYRYLPKSAAPYGTMIQLDNYSAFAGLSFKF